MFNYNNTNHRERRADLLAADRTRRDVIRVLGSIDQGWRLMITDEQLIDEAFHANVCEINDRQTRVEYRACHQHFVGFLEQYGVGVFGADPKHVKLFLVCPAVDSFEKS